MKDLKIVMLNNGTEYVGDYLSLNNHEINLASAYKITLVEVKGIYTIMLVPFSFYSSDTDIIISKSSTVGIYNPSEQIVTLYSKTIKSKLDYSEFLTESVLTDKTLN